MPLTNFRFVQTKLTGKNFVSNMIWHAALTFGLLLLTFHQTRATDGNFTCQYFQIRCIDGATGNGIPLVQLRTTGYITLYTDSNGIAAFYEPSMMNQQIWFTVLTDGYIFHSHITQQIPPYNPGILLKTIAGGSETIVLNQTQSAERIFRLTGSDIYKDSVITGYPTPISIKKSMLDETKIVGQDTLILNYYKSKVFYIFGDTQCANAARPNNCNQNGMYSVAATSCLPQPQHMTTLVRKDIKINSTCPSDIHPNLTYLSFFDNETNTMQPHKLAPIKPLRYVYVYFLINFF